MQQSLPSLVDQDGEEENGEEEMGEGRRRGDFERTLATAVSPLSCLVKMLIRTVVVIIY